MRKKFSLFFGLSRPDWAWNEARMIFLIFLRLFSKFSRSGRVKSVSNENFFPYFFAYLDPFQLKLKRGWCFLIFWFFFCFLFGNSQGRVGKKQFQTRKFFALFFCLSQPVSAWNEASMMFFNCFEFFSIILGIL